MFHVVKIFKPDLFPSKKFVFSLASHSDLIYSLLHFTLVILYMVENIFTYIEYRNVLVEMLGGPLHKNVRADKLYRVSTMDASSLGRAAAIFCPLFE